MTLAVLLLSGGIGMVLGGLILQKSGDLPRANLTTVGLLSALGPVFVVTGVQAGVLLLAAFGAAMIGASGNLLIGGITITVQKNTRLEERPTLLGLRKGLSSVCQLVSYAWTLGMASLVGFSIVYPLAGLVACIVVLIGVSVVFRRSVDVR